MVTLLAFLVALPVGSLLAAPSASGAETPQAKIKAAYMSARELGTAVTSAELRSLPADLRAAFDDASEIQKRSPAYRSGAISEALAAQLLERFERIAAKMPLSAEEKIKAEGLYLKAPGNPDRGVNTKELALVQKMLSDPALPPARRAAMKARMRELTRAFGTASAEDVGPAASHGRSTPGTMTTAQLKALNTAGRAGPKTLQTHAVPPPSKSEEPSLSGFVQDYSQGLSEHLYSGKVDVIAQRQQTKDSRTEHSAIMYRLQDYNSQHYSNPTAKTAIDVSVGTVATVMYNVPFGFALGVYQSVTGNEAPGLGLLGHVVVGISDYSRGDEKSASDHFKTGWDDIVGDLQGIATKVKDNYSDKRTN
ncbi:MAG: hypothetical protein A2V88_05495 [Elusimicrobia bacterium RBG_16_66_12]|nr:MAG: hypothetical protein A2V88_05495 [Elusimicrobia bacterium RBG_16_66_12]